MTRRPRSSNGTSLAAVLAVTVTAVLTVIMTVPAPAQAAGESYVALGDSYSSGLGTREYYADSGSS